MSGFREKTTRGPRRKPWSLFVRPAQIWPTRRNDLGDFGRVESILGVILRIRRIVYFGFRVVQGLCLGFMSGVMLPDPTRPLPRRESTQNVGKFPILKSGFDVMCVRAETGERLSLSEGKATEGSILVEFNCTMYCCSHPALVICTLSLVVSALLATPDRNAGSYFSRSLFGSSIDRFQI